MQTTHPSARFRHFHSLFGSSVRARLMRLLATIALLTFVICATSVVYFVHRTESTAWRARQQEAAHAASQAVSSFVRQADNTLTYLSHLDPVHLEEDSAILQDITQHQPEFLEVIRLDAEGTLLASAYQDRAVLANMFTIPLSQWFLQARAGEHYYGEVQVSPNDQPYLILSVPSRDGGVVAARLKMDVLWHVVADLGFGETGQAYVVSPSGRIIAHTLPAIVIDGADIAERPEFIQAAQVARHEWSGQYVNFAGESVLGVTTGIGSTGWIMITELSQAEVNQTTLTALLVLGGGLLLFTMLLLALSRRFAFRYVVSPMDKLRVGTERIGQGDLDHRIGLASDDEFGQLARAFDDMANRLRERDRLLSAQATSLATEIADRIHTEVALRQSEAHYRAIVEDQTELICRFQADGTLTFVNDAYCRYFDRTREQLVGNAFMPLIPVEDREHVEAQFGSLSPENPTITYEHRVQLDSGEIRWMQWTDRLILGTTGQLLEYQSVGQDVTERRETEDEIRRLNADLERRVTERTQQLASANDELQAEIAERRRVQITLSESQERLQQALRAAKAGAWEWHRATNELVWSPENFLVLGLDPGSVEPRHDLWLSCIHPDDREPVNAAIAQAIDAHVDLDIEYRVIWPDGSVHWISDIGRMKLDEAGQPISLYGIQLDITERKLAIEELKLSLQEKEMLLKEIHHRVKNNLQIISSVLYLQSSSIDDPLLLEQFQDSQNRIRSMALIHESLYRSDSLARIDFGGYVRDLAGSLVQTYRGQAQRVGLKVDAEAVSLTIDTAIPCGLIVNELVSNALKHAFPNGRAGQIGIELASENGNDEFQLVIWDDGIGIPEHVDIRNTTSLGLQLVNSLTRQIDGKLELCRENGTRFVIRSANGQTGE